MLLHKFVELLTIMTPAILVLLLSIFYFNKGYRNEERKMELELEIKRKKQLLPTQIRAYERILLFLERIRMENLILRNNSQANASMLRSKLVQDVRKEFEHNASQQLYLSASSWEKVSNAKNSVINLINTMSVKINPNVSSSDFSELLIKTSEKLEINAVDIAIQELKDEFQRKFK